MNKSKYSNNVRSLIRAKKEIVVSSSPFATNAAIDILNSGGNAVDAMVSAGLCLNVVHSDMTNFGGIASIMLFLPKENKITTIAGVGCWPKKANIEYFKKHHKGGYPPGIKHSIVPGAPDAWFTALRKYGTLSFEKVSKAARKYAFEGFPLNEFQCDMISKHVNDYKLFPMNKNIYLFNDKIPLPGQVMIQEKLGKLLEELVENERNYSHNSREKSLKMARDYFYKGPIAEKIEQFSIENEGFIRRNDLEKFNIFKEKPIRINFMDFEIITCGAWTQGPVLAEALSLLDEGFIDDFSQDLGTYLHIITEALKLAFADREAYFGDPRFIDVPIDIILSKEYVRQRRKKINTDKANPVMPEPGLGWKNKININQYKNYNASNPLDTAAAIVVDKDENVAVVCQSDEPATVPSPIIPELGILISPRGGQSRLDYNDPNSLLPGKRPRITPNPVLIFKDKKFYGAIVTPGADVQCQAMTQVLLNHFLFNKNPQSAVEYPRYASYSFPGSFYPFNYHPGLLKIESRFNEKIYEELKNKGHDLEICKPWEWKMGGVCFIAKDLKNKVFIAGADPRRGTYAAGI